MAVSLARRVSMSSWFGRYDFLKRGLASVRSGTMMILDPPHSQT